MCRSLSCFTNFIQTDVNLQCQFIELHVNILIPNDYYESWHKMQTCYLEHLPNQPLYIL